VSEVFLGIDAGTQSVRVLAVTVSGEVAGSAWRTFSSRRDGVRHEQDPAMWWTATAAALREVMDSLGPETRVGGVAVDATSGTILLADSGGKALTAGLMYDDGRARTEGEEVDEVGTDLWRELSYRMQPSWALPKLLWLLRAGQVGPGARLLHQNDWINFQLAGSLLATDSSHALKTGYDLIRAEWPESILRQLKISLEMLPDVVPPGTRIGEVGSAAAQVTGLRAGTSIFSGMTDGCAAQIASGATRPGDWNTVLGTTLVIKGATRDLLRDPSGVVYSHRSADGLWLPGGASSTGAGAIAAEFAPEDLEALNMHAALQGPTPLVTYPLATKGERFPFVEPEATGFTLGSANSPEERFLSVIQGLALWERLCFDTLKQMGASTEGRYFISGGAVRSEALNQMRADVLERPLTVPAVTQGAFGMAVLAAATKSSLAEATERMVRTGRTIYPRRSFSEYAMQYELLLAELHRRGWMPRTMFPATKAQVHA
jgi:sugar (pentulose or hexulose) kinase